MNFAEVIALVGLLVANGGSLALIFTNLNVKIAENAKDVLSIKNDMEEHKLKNRDDILDLKSIVLRDKSENREDHQRIVDEIGTVNNNIADLRVAIVKAMKDKK